MITSYLKRNGIFCIFAEIPAMWRLSFFIICFLLCDLVSAQSIQFCVLKGDSLVKQKKYSLAIKEYDKAIGIDSSNAFLYVRRGNTYAKKNQDKNALYDYNKAIELNPSLAEAYIQRSEIKAIHGNREGAEADLQKAEELTGGGQNEISYTATNGIIYHVRDTIKLGLGSNPNGEFTYLKIGGWGAVLNATYSNPGTTVNNVGSGYAHSNVIIKKIKFYRERGAKKVYFVVAGGNITNYNLMIEEAIATCEIDDCHGKSNAQTSVSDQLLRMSKLLDDGLITKDEFEKLKRKLLEK